MIKDNVDMKRGEGKRLLFVDDEPGIRETLPVILRRRGFAVTVAATVSEALEEIRGQQFDILLCDLNIERENDGYGIVRAIRAIDPTCIAVVLTAYPNLDSAIEGIRHGVDDYVLKPANVDTLVVLLADRLAKQPRKRERQYPIVN